MSTTRIRGIVRRGALAAALALCAAPTWAMTRIESWREYEKTRDVASEMRVLGLVALAVALTLWLAVRAQRRLDARRHGSTRRPGS